MLKRIGWWVQNVRELPDRMDQRLAFAVPLWSYWLLLGIVVVTLTLAYQHAVSVAASTKVGLHGLRRCPNGMYRSLGIGSTDHTGRWL